jgi:hypothetical protein
MMIARGPPANGCNCGHALNNTGTRADAVSSQLPYARSVPVVLCTRFVSGANHDRVVSARASSVLSMVNRAGNLVEPSVRAFQAAVEDFANNSNMVKDIVDAPGADSWPIAGFTCAPLCRRVYS